MYQFDNSIVLPDSQLTNYLGDENQKRASDKKQSNLSEKNEACSKLAYKERKLESPPPVLEILNHRH